MLASKQSTSVPRRLHTAHTMDGAVWLNVACESKIKRKEIKKSVQIILRRNYYYYYYDSHSSRSDVDFVFGVIDVVAVAVVVFVAVVVEK